jgi:hypothetical protein
MASVTGQTITQLTLSVVEKDVENSYRQYISNKIQGMVFTSPFQCDGFGVSDKYKIRLLCEFKKDSDFSKKFDRSVALSQVIVYIKKFELIGWQLPNVILIADRNEWFVLHTNEVFKYLDIDIDWSIAPSNAHTNKYLMNLLMEDESINPFIFSINQLDEVVDKIKYLAKNVIRKIPITPKNITDVFFYFEKNVLGKHNLTTNELANLFVQILINPDDNYLHTAKKRKTIVTKSFGEIPVKTKEAFNSFFSHFSKDYTPRQKEELTSVVDRLIQDITRRKQGEFFTPITWANKAHEYISSVFGEDWKEKYVVWDPAWGTGNLTRGYKFKELYASTLNYSDIQTAEQMGYNPEAVKFQFDFLNDDYDFLPKGLRDAIESEREIIILMNPPYATSNDLDNVKSKETKSKKGVSNTITKEKMLAEKLGTCSDQLYAQFIYRLYSEIKNVSICTFSPPLLLTGNSFKKFRNKVSIENNFVKGYLMDSKHFADVSSWGLAFSIFRKSVNIKKDIFSYDILELNEDYNIISSGIKSLYNTDNKNSLNDWVKVKTKLNEIFPNFKSGLSIGNKERKFNCDSFSYLVTNGNSVEKNESNCYFIPGPPNNNKAGSLVFNENFDKVCVTFTSSSLINGNWYNKKDEYLKPNIENCNYNQFVKDSIVNMLFSEKNGQTSLRQVMYKDRLWDIKNEFFWMSKDEMMDLANETNYTELYVDARTDNDRYVHQLLFGEENIYEQLSPDAKLVLDKAAHLTRTSMNLRSHFADEQNHLNSWDAGYAQLKLVWKEYFPEEFKEFRQLYKNLEDRMRPLVYELGFLLK